MRDMHGRVLVACSSLQARGAESLVTLALFPTLPVAVVHGDIRHTGVVALFRWDRRVLGRPLVYGFVLR